MSKAKQSTQKLQEHGQSGTLNGTFNPFIQPPIGQSYPSMPSTFRTTLPTVQPAFQPNGPIQQFSQLGPQLSQPPNAFSTQSFSPVPLYIPATQPS